MRSVQTYLSKICTRSWLPFSTTPPLCSLLLVLAWVGLLQLEGMRERLLEIAKTDGVLQVRAPRKEVPEKKSVGSVTCARNLGASRFTQLSYPQVVTAAMDLRVHTLGALHLVAAAASALRPTDDLSLFFRTAKDLLVACDPAQAALCPAVLVAVCRAFATAATHLQVDPGARMSAGP